MIIYNTSFHMIRELEHDFLEWVMTAYFPNLPGKDRLVARICDISEPGVSAYCVQSRCESIDEARVWHDGYGAELRERLTARYGEHVVYFTTYMEIVES